MQDVEYVESKRSTVKSCNQMSLNYILYILHYKNYSMVNGYHHKPSADLCRFWYKLKTLFYVVNVVEAK